MDGLFYSFLFGFTAGFQGPHYPLFFFSLHSDLLAFVDCSSFGVEVFFYCVFFTSFIFLFAHVRCFRWRTGGVLLFHILEGVFLVLLSLSS